MHRIKDYFILHVSIFIYSLSAIFSKLASECNFLSFEYILFLGLQVLVLGVFAILWQQAIKPFKASVAYSNKSITMLWTLLFSTCFFGETITFFNIIGAMLIVVGVILVVNSND